MSEPFSWEPGDLVLVNGMSEANFQFKVRLGKTRESFLKCINKYSILRKVQEPMHQRSS